MIRADIALLVGEIEESLMVLRKIEDFYVANVDDFLGQSGRDQRSAIVLSEILVNYYTCLETIFFRISRVFENHLQEERWHKELLHKMCLEVEGLRKAVITKSTHQLLDELRRFRHFKRYYYDFEYDWSRLDYLRSVFERLRPAIKEELQNYLLFLRQIR